MSALSTSATAWITRGLQAADPGRRVVLLADGPRTMDALYQDLHTLGDGNNDDVLYFPAWESAPGTDASGGARDLSGDRLETLTRLRREAQAPEILLTHIQAAMQVLPSPDALEDKRIHLAVGDEQDLDAFCENLVDRGYAMEAEVLDKGDASRRGGIVDVWPPNRPYPLRVEWFGDEIESIRSFDPATQRSSAQEQELDLVPASEGLSDLGENATSLFTYLRDAQWILYEPDAIREHAELYARSHNPDIGCIDEAAFWSGLQRGSTFGALHIGIDSEHRAKPLAYPIHAVAGLSRPENEGLDSVHLEKARQNLVEEHVKLAQAGATVLCCFNTPGSRMRFDESYAALVERAPGFSIREGMLAEGFHIPELALVVLAESDIYGVRKQLRTKYDAHSRTKRGASPAGARITEWTDMEPGELVVHIDHGIGRYLGLYEIAFSGQKQEVLSIEYADGAKLHLPVNQAHLLSRYIGLGNHQPDLHTLGGGRWIREKISAEKAVRDLAAQMLETQAKRDALPGYAYAADTAWQHEFEATFPYQETVDQEEAILAVKKDMERDKPMDRLICGDVGYGKTEVAMRAAFKAVMDGKQVAMLVPTTILAEQHYQAFCERMASFPVRIDLLSRFRTRMQQTATVAALKRGELDIVIGTHRLASQDVGFNDLGLVIIDEEQRFGVRHKERLKEMKNLVDVLTLSATPIPRTLYLSMTGARDISTIQTAPRERLPIRTEVDLFDPAIVRTAVLRELNREGQVFFLHNRVQSIQRMHGVLEELVPEARIAVAHGQMPERQLERVMHQFAARKSDVLLCTTIIESGVDMPNVNTIIVDRADRFGLAELYQLRGRVGRYKHQAYAYLLLPAEGGAKAHARERLRAIQRYSALGSGFKIAMRDLEIRGAGSLLGSEQSGHMTSIGFDLYCQLLDQSVRRLKKLPVNRIVDVKLRLDFVDLSPEASDPDRACAIPHRYIEDEAQRVEMYRRLASLSSEDAVDAYEAEVTDRFGRLPQALRNLLMLARIRQAAADLHVSDIEVREKKLMMLKGGDYLMRGKKFPRLYEKHPLDLLEELLHVLRT